MAAPPSKQSPSNHKMYDSDSAGINTEYKDLPTSANDAPKEGASLTYQASEKSESYLLAKQLLNSDDFEGACRQAYDVRKCAPLGHRLVTWAGGTCGGAPPLVPPKWPW